MTRFENQSLQWLVAESALQLDALVNPGLSKQEMQKAKQIERERRRRKKAKKKLHEKEKHSTAAEIEAEAGKE